MDLVADPSRAGTVRLAAQGDRRAFEELYEKYAPVVHGVLLSRVSFADAEDLVQDVFVVVLARLPGLRDAAAFPAWILQIARHLAADHHRKGDRWRPMGADRREPSVDPEALLLLDTVRSLPEAYRETLVMRLVEGLSGPEIAERTGLTADSVRVNLHRGMKILREKLGATR